MKEALALSTQHAYGVAANVVLQTVMSPWAWENFCRVREAYPDCTIELGIYDGDVGILPGDNSLIWEVRNY